ncbi:MAG: TetR/AcrR family transcriptional regulator [Thermoleophilia bacterium]|nr:TetR/AcrR family transcriptional regulator [Thermoleophilia bacterium]
MLKALAQHDQPGRPASLAEVLPGAPAAHSGAASARGAQTRARIIEATLALIAESGWKSVTTRSVADKAGVNGALIHYHFGSKKALLAEALSAVLTNELSGPTDALATGNDFEAGLRSAMDYLKTLERRSTNMVVFTEALVQATRDEGMRSWMRDAVHGFHAFTEDALSAAQARGQLAPSLDSRGTALILTALLDGLVLHRLVDPELDLDRATEALVALLHGHPTLPPGEETGLGQPPTKGAS